MAIQPRTCAKDWRNAPVAIDRMKKRSKENATCARDWRNAPVAIGRMKMRSGENAPSARGQKGKSEQEIVKRVQKRQEGKERRLPKKGADE